MVRQGGDKRHKHGHRWHKATRVGIAFLCSSKCSTEMDGAWGLIYETAMPFWACHTNFPFMEFRVIDRSAGGISTWFLSLLSLCVYFPFLGCISAHNCWKKSLNSLRIARCQVEIQLAGKLSWSDLGLFRLLLERPMTIPIHGRLYEGSQKIIFKT